MLPTFRHFDDVHNFAKNWLREGGDVVPHSRWQGLDMAERGPEWQHFEVMNFGFILPMPDTQGLARQQIKPSMPWAEDHFQERVGGGPLNPGDQYYNWPHWTDASYAVLDGEKQFSHTYMERFWPRYAGDATIHYNHPELQGKPQQFYRRHPMFGIRYRYGDLNDVVQQLLRDPYTRQAYAPIFFPEDTGAVHGGRVPCTLGYHFMLRQHKLQMWYEIRSCDLLRHFRDDVYMAVRLCQWMLAELQRERPDTDANGHWFPISPGRLTFLAHSFHCFKGDVDAGLLGKKEVRQYEPTSSLGSREDG